MNTIILILFLQQYPAVSLEITKQNQSVNVYENVQYYKELGNTTFEINRLENAKFTSEKHQVYHQLSGNTLWMRIQINNTTSEALSYYFSSYNAYLPEGQLFIKNANGIWEGHLHNYRNQLEANTYFNIPTWFVNLIPGESTLYFKFFDEAKRTRTLVFLLSPNEFKVWRIKSIGFLVFMAGGIQSILKKRLQLKLFLGYKIRKAIKKPQPFELRFRY
ncbi:MAG: 7TM-DISM domain-containing protein [Flavobacteriaceae bacterium]|nr:7TM-DISM domain-containing protein [Flavobacteriaceae bacterium]MDG1921305.1 7TM-DISM domain-containing protein [Flavobacteriaceae bacterium]